MKVYLREEFFDGSVKILFSETFPDGRYAYNFYTGERIKVVEGENPPDAFILKIPEHLKDALFKALAETLDQKGVKTENDHKIAGTLEATRYHLEDMRQLLKLKDKGSVKAG